MESAALLAAVVVGALVVFTITTGNLAGLWRESKPSAARWAAGIAGVIWIVAGSGFGVLALYGFIALMTGGSDFWSVVVVVGVIAGPVTFRLGLALFAPSRRVHAWSTLWAALCAAIAAIIYVAPPDNALGVGAGVIVVPIVAGLLSLFAWMRPAQEQ